MRSLLDKIREKPLSIRRFILNSAMGVSMLLVVMIWIASFSQMFEGEESEMEVAYEETSPLSVLGSAISSVFSGATNSIEKAQEKYSAVINTSSDPIEEDQKATPTPEALEEKEIESEVIKKEGLKEQGARKTQTKETNKDDQPSWQEQVEAVVSGPGKARAREGAQF